MNKLFRWLLGIAAIVGIVYYSIIKFIVPGYLAQIPPLVSNLAKDYITGSTVTKEMKAKLDAVCIAENLHSNELLLCLLQDFFQREEYKVSLWMRLVTDKEKESNSEVPQSSRIKGERHEL